MNITTVPAHALLAAGHRPAADPTPAGDPASTSGAPGTEGRGPGDVVADVTSPGELPGVVVVQVDGEIDLYTGPRLLDVLKELLPTPSPSWSGGGTRQSPAHDHERPSGRGERDRSVVQRVRAVVVDLTEVTFMDSYAVGVLVRGHRLARPGGRAYAVVATHPLIRSLFAITGLAKVMPLHPDVASAVEALHPAASSTTAAPSPKP